MERENKIIYTCESRMCGYIFELKETEEKRCPDCGKCRIRQATPKEIQEFLERPKHTQNW